MRKPVDAMKIYLVYEDDYGGAEIIGCYSNFVLAEEALKNSEAYKKNQCNISIKELYLDDVRAFR